MRCRRPPKALSDEGWEYWHYLAEKLGVVDVTEMLRTTPNRELTRWRLFHERKAARQELAAKMPQGGRQ